MLTKCRLVLLVLQPELNNDLFAQSVQITAAISHSLPVQHPLHTAPDFFPSVVREKCSLICLWVFLYSKIPTNY